MKASEIDIVTAYSEVVGMSAAHRDPNEAGEADRYYGRNPVPNFAYHGTTFQAEEMTAEQIDAYWRGYHGAVNKAEAWRKA